ncbi:cupin [Actinotalea sp. M2MS4P-6]|uniref:cupin n=1 Tax=Actinotalea sp. M2MS4P-6 TaxID=2983762 RepID=UPI0021E4A400|nr:cupin [Actinotalea sp. M2MS4P-6]MCV2394796.1 cupin [Actinotalea sp. M2MS4P-6]
MSGVTAKSFNVPDEQRTPPSTTVDVVHLGTHHVARLTFQPGWQWSVDVAPVVGTRYCQVRHVGSVQSGRIHVVHADGSVADLGVGDAYVIEPDHDAWVVGDDPVVVVEFESAAVYGRASAGIDARHIPEND